MPSDEDEAMPVAQETERADRNHDRQHMTAPGQTPEGQHPTTQPIHVAPVQTVPRRDYVHVEYPGVVSTHPQPSGDTVHRSNLDTALATLSPHPPPYSTVFSALDHLGCIVSLKSKVIECRPWIADYYSDDQAQASTSTLAGPKTGAEMDLFRHALTGHLVETNNFVAVVQRRVWRRVRRTKGTRVQQSSPAVSGDRNTRSAQSRGSSPSQVVSKEYTVEPLGVARHTARWRTMADFVYEPNLGNASSRSPDKRGDGEKIVSVPTSLVEAQGDASEDVAGTTQTADVDMDTVGLNEASQRQTSPTTDLASRDEVDSSDVDGKNQSVPESQVRTPNEQSEPSKRPPTGGLMTLYDALVRMDVDSLCSFAMPGEKEDYEIEETGTEPPQKKSNARMVPPPAFTRVELPFPYAFRQAPLSGVETWQRILPDGNKQEVKRWVNHSRWQNISPTQWFLHFDTPVPTGPQSHIAKMAERCDKRLLNKLRRLFEDRPVWTRAALLNQLDTTEDRRTVTFSKEYLPLVSYAIPEGVYSTTYVRFGFDVRSDSACRQYQVLKFQTPDSRLAPGRARFSKAYGGAHASGTGSRVARTAQNNEDVPSPVGPAARRRSESAKESNTAGSVSPESGLDTLHGEPLKSHIFDGEHIPGRNPTFMLMDVTDPIAREYIDVAGEGYTLSRPTPETGWYTTEALERIRTVVSARFHVLFEEGRPATRAEVNEALAPLNVRQANRAAAHRRGSTLPPEAATTQDS